MGTQSQACTRRGGWEREAMLGTSGANPGRKEVSQGPVGGILQGKGSREFWGGLVGAHLKAECAGPGLCGASEALPQSHI